MATIFWLLARTTREAEGEIPSCSSVEACRIDRKLHEWNRTQKESIAPYGTGLEPFFQKKLDDAINGGYWNKVNNLLDNFLQNPMTDYKKWGIVIIFGLFFYSLNGVILHFFNHFFPSVALGIIILIVLTLLGKNTQKYEFTIPFIVYIYAIIPEFIAIARNVTKKEELHHQAWENIFLLHTTLDRWLEQTKLIVLLTAFVLFITIIVYKQLR